MFLCVGLGNPGTQYLLNRHNLGFMAMDGLRQEHNFPIFSQKFNGAMSQANIGQHNCLLLKPMTYMNLSGQSVQKVMQFYKIPIENVCVFHDDLDLDTFNIKIKQGGSAGGHNGLKSIDQHCGNNYWRVRLGISHPGEKHLVSPYVLSNFPKEEMKELPFFINQIIEKVPEIFTSMTKDKK